MPFATCRHRAHCKLNEWHLGLLTAVWLVVLGASVFFDWSLYQHGVLVSHDTALICAIVGSVLAVVVLGILLRKAAILRNRQRDQQRLLVSEYTRHLYGTADPADDAVDDLDLCRLHCCIPWGRGQGSSTKANPQEPTTPSSLDSDLDTSARTALVLTPEATPAELMQVSEQLRKAARNGKVEHVRELLVQLERVPMTADVLEATGRRAIMP